MSYLHDATPTWNGFNYQGKIALLVVLDKLIELKKTNSDIEGYNIELEWLEDFSLKKYDDYISIHQVKNYGDNNLNSYDEAILSLLSKLLKVITPNEITQIITQRSIKKEDKIVIAESIFEKLKEVNLITSNSIEVDKLGDFKFTDEIRGKFKKPDDVLERLKDVLNHYDNIAKNCEKLEHAFLHVAESVNDFTTDNIKNIEIIKNSTIAANDNFDESLTQLKLYEYDTGINNCTNSDINSFLNLRLKVLIQLLENNNEEHYFKIQDSYLTKTICILLSLIDDHVEKRHQAIRDRNSGRIQTIKFDEFVAIVLTNHDHSHSYDAYTLKEVYTRTFEEFLEEHKTNNEVCEFLVKVTNHNFENYKGEKFIDFSSQITPHTSTFNNKSTLLQEGGLRNSFFDFFSKVVMHNNIDICVKDKLNQSHLITTLHENGFSTQRQHLIYKNIKKNSIDIPYTFNIESFAGSIGKGNGGKQCSEIISNETKAPQDNSQKSNSKKITVSENFTVIDINDLIDNL